MIDFTKFRDDKGLSLAQFAVDFSKEDLRAATDGIIDRQLALIADCTDADVVFAPEDPDANDPFAENPEDVAMAWNLGHLIAHVTASSEECAFLAAELARGVAWHGRSRSEVPWEEMTTVARCRQRLEESRRMRLASLDLWPDEPYLHPVRSFDRARIGDLNCIGYFLFGLLHDDGHLAQIEKVIQEAKESRQT